MHIDLFMAHLWQITKLKRIPLGDLGLIELKERTCVNKDGELTDQTGGDNPLDYGRQL